MNEFIFDIKTPLGISVRCSTNYWEETILIKHSILRDRLNEVAETLKNPEFIRQSKKDTNVLLFYSGTSPRWLCAVIKNKQDYGFLITAYPTDAIKEGIEIWKR